MKKIDIERINELYLYDKNKGTLIWNKSKHSLRFGKEAGCVSHGYRMISIDGTKFLAHRLVWFIEKGKWPSQIDHINGDRGDNRIINLREVTVRQNAQNQESHRKGKLVGTSFHKTRKKWYATVTLTKKIHLGSFDTELEAHEAYKKELTKRGLR